MSRRRSHAHEGADLSGFHATYHDVEEIGAGIASGSHRHDGMVIIPCSAKTLSAIATGYADNLITRTADVCLKERRKCILVTREMPLSKIHLKTCLRHTMPGRRSCRPARGSTTTQKQIDDLVDMVVGRVLDHLEVDHTLTKRWSGYDA